MEWLAPFCYGDQEKDENGDEDGNGGINMVTISKKQNGSSKNNDYKHTSNKNTSNKNTSSKNNGNSDKSVLSQFARYASLNVLGMIGLSCYILADTYFIANGVGSDGLAALNLAIPVYSLVNGTGLMLGIGGATKYAIYQGQRSKENGNVAFTQTVMMAVISAIIYMFIGVFFSPMLATALGATGEVFEMTRIYLQMILLFSPAFLLNNVFISFIRNDGNPRLAMCGMLLGSFVNIVLDYIFVFPLQMGIFGAVLATGFSPLVSMGILSTHLIKKQNQFHLRKQGIGISMVSSMLALGFPSLITEVASGIVIIVFNYLTLGLTGNIGVAAYGVIANISLVATAIFTGLAQGMQPLTSQFYGSGNRESIQRVLRYGMITGAVVAVAIYGLVFFFADPIAMAFNNEQNLQLQQIAVEGLRIYFVAIPFVGVNILLSMYFTSVEKAGPAQIISLLRGLFLIVPVAFVLARCFAMTGIWLALPVTELVVCLVAVALYRKTK